MSGVGRPSVGQHGCWRSALRPPPTGWSTVSMPRVGQDRGHRACCAWPASATRPVVGQLAAAQLWAACTGARWRFGRPVVASPCFSAQAWRAVWGYASQVAGPRGRPAGWRRACWGLGVASGGWPGGDFRPTLGLASQRPASRRIGLWREHAGQGRPPGRQRRPQLARPAGVAAPCYFRLEATANTVYRGWWLPVP